MFSRYIFPLVLLVFFTSSSCLNTEKRQAAEILTNHYPNLYEAVFDRNAEQLMAFTAHKDSVVARQAWRALMSTPLSSEQTDSLITLAFDANTPVAWMAVANQYLDISKAARLQRIWNASPEKRKGISYAVGRAGFRQSLNLIMLRFDEVTSSEYEFEAALAISRLANNGMINESTEEKLVNRALNSDDTYVAIAYLYGFYRNDYKFKSDSARQKLWQHFKAEENSLLSKYILKIVGEEYIHEIKSEWISAMNVQMAVELVQLLGRTEWSDNHKILLSRLLEYPNPVVKTQALLALGEHSEHILKLQQELELLLSKEGQEARIWLEAMYNITLAGVPVSEQQLRQARGKAADDGFLVPVYYRIMAEAVSEQEFVKLLDNEVQNQKGKQRLFAVNALGEWWSQLDEETKREYEEVVRTLTETIFKEGSRSSVYAAAGFLLDAFLYDTNEFHVIEKTLKRFSLPNDIEVYQAFTGIVKQRFEEQGRSLIDSLAAIKDPALNRFLKQQEWDLPGVEDPKKRAFRKPDWQRLAEMGSSPDLILHTDKGTIRIELDVLAAPVTISAIDSLVGAAAYEETPFHRVVPNFVIQGGDIESGDGFGNAGFVLPTEASEKHFKRGMVGIASAGTDTESSQFFIMHQWKPHLNNKYTIIGEVVEGLSVVDRITVGDRVLYAEIEN